MYAGGLFAMDRKQFYRLGMYDAGQETWGGENIEMSFRCWMCGSRLEILPCSRIAHVFRAKAPYKFKDADAVVTISRNLNRVAEVWMDGFAGVYYNLTNRQSVLPGDVSARRTLRNKLGCSSFAWYANVSDVTCYIYMVIYMYASSPVTRGLDRVARSGWLQQTAAYDTRLCLSVWPRSPTTYGAPSKTLYHTIPHTRPRHVNLHLHRHSTTRTILYTMPYHTM